MPCWRWAAEAAYSITDRGRSAFRAWIALLSEKEAALAFDPIASRTSFDQALRAYRSGDRIGARRQVDALLARDAKDAQARFLLARLCLEGGDPATAAQHLQQVTAR